MHTGRVDFHLHSWASNVTTYYAANAFSLPESYSDPEELYALLKSRGMSLVTLTDHNAITGCQLLLDKGRDDVFISSELTATFPEDGCNIHVTVANVTEAQFAEAERLRHNLYELVAYLDLQIALEDPAGHGNKLAYFMTHPLMSTENRAYGREGSLTVGHIEKALVLLPGFEVHNGSRTRALNNLMGEVLTRLDPLHILTFAERHGLAPRTTEPWKKFVTGGSDDHGGINPGLTFTEFPYPGATPTPNDLVIAMRRHETRTGGKFGGPITLANTLLKLLYDTSRRGRATPKAKANPQPQRATPPTAKAQAMRLSPTVEGLLALVFGNGEDAKSKRFWFGVRIGLRRLWPRKAPTRLSGLAFEAILDDELSHLLMDASFRAALRAPDTTTDDRIFLVVSTLINRLFARYAKNLTAGQSGNVIGVIKDAVALFASHLFVSLPYLTSFLTQANDSLVARDVRKAFGISQHAKLVLVTDTFFDVNGVSATIKRMLREAIRRDIDFTVVTCLTAEERTRHLTCPEIRAFFDSGRLRLFEPSVHMDLPEYDGLVLRVPPLLDLLRYLQEEGFTKMQISTPGPLGMVGLIAAKLLQIETAATYHTSFPEYVENYTRDISLEHFAWKYMIAFYLAVDEVLVPSRFIAKLLHKRGLRNRKLLILDRWVDTERFHPRHRVAGYFSRYGLQDERLVKLVYVGRLGVEKNLRILAEAFRRVAARHHDVHLVLIGDGPFRAELEGLVKGLPVTFTGFVEGPELPRAVASCDIKLFPSMTDTWGNAPLEAQASGLPVIVSEVGGPIELMEPGVTGLVVPGRDVESLVAAIEQLLDPAVRAQMGHAARVFAEVNRVDLPFTAVFDSNGYRKRAASRDEAGQTNPTSITTEVFDPGHAVFDVPNPLGPIGRADRWEVSA